MFDVDEHVARNTGAKSESLLREPLGKSMCPDIVADHAAMCLPSGHPVGVVLTGARGHDTQ